MHALILAAGCGSRLGTQAPKCLSRIGGHTLLGRQLHALQQVGVEAVSIVVGYKYEQVEREAFGWARFVRNRRYAETNSMYSFHLARAEVAGDVLVLNSDVLFPVEVLTRLLATSGSAVAVDSSSGCDDEHMKVRLESGRLVSMSKSLAPHLTAGENLGVLLLRDPVAQATFDAAERLIVSGQEREWLGAAMSAVAAQHEIVGVDVAGLPWVEIDFPADLALARHTIWPMIEKMERFRDHALLAQSAHYAEAQVAG